MTILVGVLLFILGAWVVRQFVAGGGGTVGDDSAENPNLSDDPQHWNGPEGYDRVRTAIQSANQPMISRIAAPGVSLPWRQMAVEALEDQQLLRIIALGDDSLSLRVTAGRRLTSAHDLADFETQLRAWVDTFLTSLLYELPVVANEPNVPSRCTHRDAGTAAQLGEYMCEESNQSKNYGELQERSALEKLCEFAKKLAGDIWSTRFDESGQGCLHGLLKFEDEDHDKQHDTHYISVFYNIWVTRIDSDRFAWKVGARTTRLST